MAARQPIGGQLPPAAPRRLPADPRTSVPLGAPRRPPATPEKRATAIILVRQGPPTMRCGLRPPSPAPTTNAHRPLTTQVSWRDFRAPLLGDRFTKQNILKIQRHEKKTTPRDRFTNKINPQNSNSKKTTSNTQFTKIMRPPETGAPRTTS